MPECLPDLKSASRTPARDRAFPLLPQAIAEGWSVRDLAEKAKISRDLARILLKQASEEQRELTKRELSSGITRAIEVAQSVRDRQVEQAERIDALTERALSDLEARAEAGALDVRDLETLTRLRDRHWQHVKDMAGINVAEKIAVAQAKGEAAGKGFASGLIDATALELGDGVYEIAASGEN